MAFQSLVNGMAARKAVVVNTNWMRELKNPGRFDLLRAVESLATLARVYAKLRTVDTVYLIVSTSRLGFLRDAAIILPASLMGRKIVTHLHGGGMRQFYLSSGSAMRAMIRKVYRRVYRLIVLGERLRGQFRFLPDRTRIVVVPNSLPAGMAPPRQNRTGPGSRLSLLYLSNVTPSKGILDLIEAVALLGRNRDVELHVCGAFLSDVDKGGGHSTEDVEDRVHGLVKKLGLQKTVHFHGTVTGQDKEAMLARCDVFVLPTYYKWEGQPLSIIEAQAWGLPVVTTDHRAIGDTVLFGQSAERAEKRNPRSIAQAIARIAADPETYGSYSATAIENYERRFRAEVHIRNMERLLLT